MKKLLYVVRYPLYENFHLKRKFDGQLNAFQNLGFDVYYIGFDKRYFYLINGSERRIIGKTRFYIPNYFHTLLNYDYCKHATKLIEEQNFDYVYYRACPAWPTTALLARRIDEKAIDFFYEVSTYLSTSKEKSMNFLRAAYLSIASKWDKQVLSAVNLFLLVGDPAPNYYLGRPACNLSNGITVKDIPLRKPVVDKATIHILALSSMCSWHGYDRLIRSLAEYNGPEEVIIHFVGSDDGGCLQEWKSLVKEKQLENRVLFHGALFGEELDRMFDLCDIGVNSLGMYRKGTNVTSELKAKEYVARGLPFVSSVRDELLDGLDDDLFLRIANDDTIPSMDSIVEFAKRTRTDETASIRLRNYAEHHLSWEDQYRKIFEYYEGIKI